MRKIEMEKVARMVSKIVTEEARKEVMGMTLGMVLGVIILSLIFYLPSCAKWEVLSPNANGELALRVQNVEICFLYKEQKIEVYNKNWESCWVNIARLETWSNYYSIFDRPVGGRNFVSEKAFFESGDKIQIKIYLDNSENEKTEIYSYFRLGKVVYDGDEKNAEVIEFRQEGDSIIAEITL